MTRADFWRKLQVSRQLLLNLCSPRYSSPNGFFNRTPTRINGQYFSIFETVRKTLWKSNLIWLLKLKTKIAVVEVLKKKISWMKATEILSLNGTVGRRHLGWRKRVKSKPCAFLKNCLAAALYLARIWRVELRRRTLKHMWILFVKCATHPSWVWHLH